MATKKKVKTPSRRLYEEVHVLTIGGMDSNCYMQVIGEFAGGHDGWKSFDGARLTSAEWFAVLKDAGVTAGLVFFGGVNTVIEQEYPLGQEAFTKFLVRNGIEVHKTSSQVHTGYLAYLTPDFMEKVKKADLKAHYTTDPNDDIWNRGNDY